MPPRLLVSCGEPSGDLYAADLVRELTNRIHGMRVFGLGGDRLAAVGATLVAHVRELAVVGLLEVVSHLPRLHAVFRSLLEAVERERPSAALLVDYPDFNLRLARELRRRGIPVIYYVAPQVWAWRRWRMRTIRESVERVLVIFPFEEALYRAAKVPVSFVGHPLVDLVRPAPERGAFLSGLGLDPARPVVAVLPGSRRKEVAHNLPPLAGAIRLMRARRPEAQFLAAVAPTLDPVQVRGRLDGLSVVPVIGQTHATVGAADLAIVASGTATVEAALLGTPMVVVYRVSSLTYLLGRPFVSVPHYAMVNLIAGRRVVPELMQWRFTAERVAREAMSLLADRSRLAQMREDLAAVRRQLGEPGASARAAEIIQRRMQQNP